MSILQVTATLKTQKIAGHDVTLEDGEWYIACREIMRPGQRKFRTSVHTHKNGHLERVITVGFLGYDDANEFLAEFNNGELSFNGRVW